MSVIQTQNLVYKFTDACKKQKGKSVSDIQCEVICESLLKLFPMATPQAVQYELLRNGLFDPNEWSNLEKIVRDMEEHGVWQNVNKEFGRLRALWKGPKVPIYIFPITRASTNSREKPPTKNGVAYKDALFLFLSAELSKDEIKALLAHEYNHVCRINYLNLPPNEISLLDSLIIEGLGEYAVKDLYGKKLLAPWIKLYSFDEARAIWRDHFVPSLKMKGVKNHQIFLYGNPKKRVPKWIGYHIGYQIVATYQKNHGPFVNEELYFKTSKEILAGSDFSLTS